MAERKRKRRTYLALLQKSQDAIHEAVDCFNRVHGGFKVENCLILLSVSWELFAKAILVKKREKIQKGSKTISGEVAVSKLRALGLLDENQEDCLQQVISLRNHASHNLLPALPEEVLHHLFFFACKFHKDLAVKLFPAHARHVQRNFLSLSFSDLTTYADRFKKNAQDRQALWLLERGIRFDGTEYMSQDKFEREYAKRRKVAPHLAVSKFIQTADMVRIVPVQAPKNYSVDISLRKGSPSMKSLPVMVRKTEIEADYPYLTVELGAKLGKDVSFIAATSRVLNYKGNPKYHQQIRSSKSGAVHRYSEAALAELRDFYQKNPGFNPYKMKAAAIAPPEPPKAQAQAGPASPPSA